MMYKTNVENDDQEHYEEGSSFTANDIFVNKYGVAEYETVRGEFQHPVLLPCILWTNRFERTIRKGRYQSVVGLVLSHQALDLLQSLNKSISCSIISAFEKETGSRVVQIDWNIRFIYAFHGLFGFHFWLSCLCARFCVCVK
jgi:hypothetical protein